jgi:hypothetical protein
MPLPPLRPACLPARPPVCLQGVENVYTQHTPALVGLLERLARAKLPDMDYPRVDRDHSPQAPRVGWVWLGGWVVGWMHVQWVLECSR